MTGRKARQGVIDPADPVAVRFIERIGVLTRNFPAPFEPVIPWASLLPPQLPRFVEASPAHPR